MGCQARVEPQEAARRCGVPAGDTPKSPAGKILRKDLRELAKREAKVSKL